MKQVKRLTLLYTSAMLIAPFGTAFAAQAAPSDAVPIAADDAANQAGDIIVTAQKRNERLADVPLSITAASGQSLIDRGVTSPDQLEKVVPGFTFQRTEFGAPVFAIRGIGFFDTQLGASPAVTVYTDQVPLPFLAMTRGATLDLDRLEALKGPQGTLFGQNSTGGAINYIAAKPTDALHAGFQIEGGRFDSVNAEAFVSGPIAENLTARIAGRYEYRGGWQTSQSRPGDDYGSDRFYNGRLLLDWAPSDRVSFEVNLNGWKDKAQLQAPQFVAFVPQAPIDPFNTAAYLALSNLTPAPDDARVADWDADRFAPTDTSFYQASLRSDIAFSNAVKLTSITAYSHFKTDARADLDGTAYPDLYYLVHSRIHSFSQELRLDGESGRLRWMIGGNYQDDHVIENWDNFISSTNGGVGPFRYNEFVNLSKQDTRTISGFGSLEFQLADQLTLQGSARYSEQKRDFAGCLADNGNGQLATAFGLVSTLFSGSPTIIPPGSCVTLNNDPNNMTVGQNKPVPIVNDTLKEDNVSWRASLNWKPSANSLVYANITKGFKSGNYTILPAVFSSQIKPVTQESVLAYEAGIKTSLMRRTVQISAAAFYYDYRDKQLLGAVLIPPFGNLPVLVNIPKSRIYGAEGEVVARPIDGLRLTFGVTYVNSRVTRDPSNPRDPFGNLVSFVGEKFPNTPKWQGVYDAEYEFSVSNTLNLFFGAGGNLRSSSFAQFGELPQFKIPSYALLDLRAGVATPDGRLRFQIWGRNVTNKFYLTGVQRPIDTIIRYTGMPVTYGATLSFRY